MAERAAIILAAGVSSRMNTQIAKVLHEVCGRPMLAYVLDACREVGIKKIYVVVGFSSEGFWRPNADRLRRWPADSHRDIEIPD